MVSIGEILEKYPIKIKDVPKELLDKKISKINIDDVKEPEEYSAGNGYKYTFKAKNYQIFLDNYLDNYALVVRYTSEDGNVHSTTYDSGGDIVFSN